MKETSPASSTTSSAAGSSRTAAGGSITPSSFTLNREGSCGEEAKGHLSGAQISQVLFKRALAAFSFERDEITPSSFTLNREGSCGEGAKVTQMGLVNKEDEVEMKQMV